MTTGKIINISNSTCRHHIISFYVLITVHNSLFGSQWMSFNDTGVTEFFLLGLSDDPRIRTLHGVLFLMAYPVALLGNGHIMILTTWDPQLHTPMYFFIKNQSFIDLCSISFTVPKFFS